MGTSKRKKFHDKDKYYRLAKEQGLRSRAAFKLSQINRKFPVLQNAKVVLDLCAAPGGWSQVASRAMAGGGNGKGSVVVAVDILPIRSLGNNVVTLIGDITTSKCKSEIKGALAGAQCDLVLHDGAPNVGASWSKDAYFQNEMALHALQCATQHLKAGGHFWTKLYRSQDYAKYLWVVQQLFQQVQAVKPSASRAQSAEIFLVCQHYLAPKKLDPKLLDPKYIFEQVEGDTSAGDALATGSNSKFNVFHKSWDSAKRRRGGYDMEQLDFSMRNIMSVADFIRPSASSSSLSPIDILSQATGLAFTCKKCKDDSAAKSANDSPTLPLCNCQFYLNHKATTPEIKACVSDLKVLNKSDFKGLLTWRTKLQEALKEHEEETRETEEDMAGNGVDSVADEEDDIGDGGEDDEDDEDEIQQEIEDLRLRRQKEAKRRKKKERTAASKRRQRAAYGMDLNAIEVPTDDQVFSLASVVGNEEQLEATREVNLDQVTHEQAFGASMAGEDGVDMNDDESVQSQGEKDDFDEETGYSYRLDRELDDAYDRYLASKNKKSLAGTRMLKRKKKLQKQKATAEAMEDEELNQTQLDGNVAVDADTRRYAALLDGNGSGDDDDSEKEEGMNDDDDNSDGYFDQPLTPAEYEKKKQKSAGAANFNKLQNPLIHKLEEAPSAKTARWFSNPLFDKIGTTAELASMAIAGDSMARENKTGFDFESEGAVSEDEKHDDEEVPKSTRKAKSLSMADEVLASMPKTDKQIRHEKRIKARERDERRQKRKARQAENDAGLEVVAAEQDDEEDERLQSLTESQRRKTLEARELIKAGMGNSSSNSDNGIGHNFEVVPADRPLALKDERKYDSENEDYDSDDYAQTLALGTMMLRRSRAKALVDASYNRFAWNDPSDLPDWFVDDEQRHYRPQLPIPPELMRKMKEKMMALSTRPIAKVAEARARKSKRAKAKLVAAKKKAEAVANSSEMSESMKLKAISKAMRSQDVQKPSKTYVVAKKGGQNKGGKGMKLVDKREKSDKRSMERADKKRKYGKKGGLTGSKRRRHHS